MSPSQPRHIRTINEYHRLMRLARPQHPLISVIRFEDIRHADTQEPINMVIHHYSIALKRNFGGKMKYGQQVYDFDEGIMTFMAPGQVLRIEWEPHKEVEHTGWMLLIHPDFIWNTTLAKNIKQYAFFDYKVHEALFLSEKEEATVVSVMQSIAHEYSANIDQFTQSIIIAHLEVLLNYAERFYNRQFITRKVSNHKLIERMEEVLSGYLAGNLLAEQGVPTVTYLADALNVSPGYLGSMLRALTGKNTQQHIHDRLIDLAKEKLTTTALSVSEIAYQLGFGHPQSFSKLFKAKTNLSPLEFRQSFN
jgi:AraC family transcriptional regulator, transcriptional activator of pobA